MVDDVESADNGLFVGELTVAFRESVEAGKKQGLIDPELDRAVIQEGDYLARRIDAAAVAGDVDDLNRVLYLTPHLKNTFRELLITPASRGVEPVEEVRSAVDVKLDSIRADLKAV